VTTLGVVIPAPENLKPPAPAQLTVPLSESALARVIRLPLSSKVVPFARISAPLPTGPLAIFPAVTVELPDNCKVPEETIVAPE